MDLAEDFLVHIVADVLEKNQEELKILERDLSKLEKIKNHSREFLMMTQLRF